MRPSPLLNGCLLLSIALLTGCDGDGEQPTARNLREAMERGRPKTVAIEEYGWTTQGFEMRNNVMRSLGYSVAEVKEIDEYIVYVYERPEVGPEEDDPEIIAIKAALRMLHREIEALKAETR